MTINRFYDLVRHESGLEGTLKGNGFIRECIFEILRDLTAVDLMQECYVPDTDVTAIGVAQRIFSLPTDYQHLAEDSVRFIPAGNLDKIYFLFESNRNNFTNAGPAARYQIVQNAIQIFPYQNVAIGDKVRIDYYGAIQDSIDWPDTGPFPIANLESTVKKECIARLKRVLGKDASVMEADANRSFARSKGNGTSSE